MLIFRDGGSSDEHHYVRHVKKNKEKMILPAMFSPHVAHIGLFFKKTMGDICV
jgi:hypothetical protein